MTCVGGANGSAQLRPDGFGPGGVGDVTWALAHFGSFPGWSAGRARLTLNQDKRRRFDSYPGNSLTAADLALFRAGHVAPSAPGSDLLTGLLTVAEGTAAQRAP